ncbi:MAG: hypothetical protein L6R35_007310 [Caloplaca aegaea]|nr:MAG: hypothetical protein L6R35_007310 [Caloplaca aegaea]
MSSPEEFLINQHTDTTDARLIRTTKHLREEDLTDADAPGESDEPLINQPRWPRAPERNAGRHSSGRPRRARAPSPHPRAPSPIPTVSKRRPPTAAERAVASDYVRELQDELDTIWLSRNHKKEIQMKILEYNQIAEGGFIEAPSANSPKSRKRPATQTMHAQSRASSVDPNGNRSSEREFLQLQREEYIRDNPQFFKTSRRKPNSKVDENDYELAAAYTPRPSKQRRRNRRGEKEEESDRDIYAPAAIAPRPTKQRRQKHREEEEQTDRHHYATAAVSSSSRPRKQRRQESHLKKAEEEAETERDEYELVARYVRQQNLERKKKTSQKARASE